MCVYHLGTQKDWMDLKHSFKDSTKMNYRDELDDFKLDNEDDWKNNDFTSSKKYQPTTTSSSYKKLTDFKRSSYSDNDDFLDFAPSSERKYSRDDDLPNLSNSNRQLGKKYSADLYNNTTFKDNNINENFKDDYKDLNYKLDNYKDNYKNSYKDTFKDNYKDDLTKTPERKYNDLDKKFSSASELSDFDDKKLTKRISNNLYDANPISKQGEFYKSDYRRPSDLRKSIDLGKVDKIDSYLDSQLESGGGKITLDLTKDRYRGSFDEERNKDSKTATAIKSSKYNYDDYFNQQSDTDLGATQYRKYSNKYSDLDRYSDSNTQLNKSTKYDKYRDINSDKQYDSNDGILDEIRRMKLTEKVRENEIETELNNADNVLKHQNNKYLHKTDSLDNQIKNASNLTKTSSKFF